LSQKSRHALQLLVTDNWSGNLSKSDKPNGIEWNQIHEGTYTNLEKADHVGNKLFKVSTEEIDDDTCQFSNISWFFIAIVAKRYSYRYKGFILFCHINTLCSNFYVCQNLQRES
jgi:hypothetical protein